MKRYCNDCEKELEFEEKNVLKTRRIDSDSFFTIECRMLVCPQCHNGKLLCPDVFELDDIARRMRRAKHKLLHWDDIVEFQKQIGWSNKELGIFIHKDNLVEACIQVDETLDPEMDKKLRNEMERHGYKPKWDTIELEL